MKILTTLSLSVAASMIAMGAAAEGAGDPVRGLNVYKKCASCHMVGENVRNRVGPPLNNIVSAAAGNVEGFKYSKAMRAAAEGGLTWTPEALDAFLQAPKTYMPKTKMSFRGLKDAADRSDVIAYLATFSQGAVAAATVEAGFTVSAEILAIEGDVEYGEYLGSECTTCHQANDEIAALAAYFKSLEN